MSQEMGTIVIYSGQHLLLPPMFAEVTSKSVSAGDKPDKHEFERALSIQFQVVGGFLNLFLGEHLLQLSKPSRHIPPVGRSAIWQ